jgi:hypothetical protein
MVLIETQKVMRCKQIGHILEMLVVPQKASQLGENIKIGGPL